MRPNEYQQVELMLYLILSLVALNNDSSPGWASLTILDFERF
jgi:hypothetical protein